MTTLFGCGHCGKLNCDGVHTIRVTGWTHELVCTRCGTNAWQKAGSVKDACWCGGRERATVTNEIARAMRRRLPSDDNLSTVSLPIQAKEEIAPADVGSGWRSRPPLL